MQRMIEALWIVMAGVASWAAAAPVPLDLSTGRPMVVIEVAGHDPLTMILDTGAGGSLVDTAVARELELEVVGEDQVGDPTGRNLRTAERVVLKGASLAGHELGELELVAFDLAAAFGHDKRQHLVDGVLSIRTLAGFLVDLDLGAGELGLSSGALDAGADGVVPYYLEGDIPWINLKVGALTVRAFLDTGNPGLLSLPKALAEQLDLAEPLEKVGEARTVSNTFGIFAAPLAGTVAFAGHEIHNPTLTFDELHRGTQANIGSGLLRRFVVTLDQANQLVRFTPKAADAGEAAAGAHPVH